MGHYIYISILTGVFFINSIWTFNFFRWFLNIEYRSPAQILAGRLLYGSVPCIVIIYFVSKVSKNLAG
jgi:hypothetical protein